MVQQGVFTTAASVRVLHNSEQQQRESNQKEDMLRMTRVAKGWIQQTTWPKMQKLSGEPDGSSALPIALHDAQQHGGAEAPAELTLRVVTAARWWLRRATGPEVRGRWVSQMAMLPPWLHCPATASTLLPLPR